MALTKEEKAHRLVTKFMKQRDKVSLELSKMWETYDLLLDAVGIYNSELEDEVETALSDIENGLDFISKSF